MANPVTYAYSTWAPDAFGTDANHPVTSLDPMNQGSSNDAAGWVRRLESEMRRRSSVGGQWEEWLGIVTPYAPDPGAPVYVSATSFSLKGDWTSPSAGFYPAIALVGRRIKAFTTGSPTPVGIIGTITAATFGGSLTTITVMWDGAGALDSSLSEVQFGIPARGQATLGYFTVAKLSAQNFSGTSNDTDFTFPIASFSLWGVRLMLFIVGGGSGGGVTLTPLVPAASGFRFGVPGWSGAVSSWVSSGGIVLAGNNPYWTADVIIQTGATAGTVSFQYSAATVVTGVSALSTMIAQQIW